MSTDPEELFNGERRPVADDRVDTLVAVALDRAETPSALLHAVARVLDQGVPTDPLPHRLRLMARTRAMYEEAAPRLGHEWAQDVAGNVAQAANNFSLAPRPYVQSVARSAIRHRIDMLGMPPMSDEAIVECGRAMADAWRRDR